MQQLILLYVLRHSPGIHRIIYLRGILPDKKGKKMINGFTCFSLLNLCYNQYKDINSFTSPLALTDKPLTQKDRKC